MKKILYILIIGLLFININNAYALTETFNSQDISSWTLDSGAWTFYNTNSYDGNYYLNFPHTTSEKRNYKSYSGNANYISAILSIPIESPVGSGAVVGIVVSNTTSVFPSTASDIGTALFGIGRKNTGEIFGYGFTYSYTTSVIWTKTEITVSGTNVVINTYNASNNTLINTAISSYSSIININNVNMIMATGNSCNNCYLDDFIVSGSNPNLPSTGSIYVTNSASSTNPKLYFNRNSQLFTKIDITNPALNVVYWFKFVSASGQIVTYPNYILYNQLPFVFATSVDTNEELGLWNVYLYSHSLTTGSNVQEAYTFFYVLPEGSLSADVKFNKSSYAFGEQMNISYSLYTYDTNYIYSIDVYDNNDNFFVTLPVTSTDGYNKNWNHPKDSSASGIWNAFLWSTGVSTGQRNLLYSGSTYYGSANPFNINGNITANPTDYFFNQPVYLYYNSTDNGRILIEYPNVDIGGGDFVTYNINAGNNQLFTGFSLSGNDLIGNYTVYLQTFQYNQWTTLSHTVFKNLGNSIGGTITFDRHTNVFLGESINIRSYINSNGYIILKNPNGIQKANFISNSGILTVNQYWLPLSEITGIWNASLYYNNGTYITSDVVSVGGASYNPTTTIPQPQPTNIQNLASNCPTGTNTILEIGSNIACVTFGKLETDNKGDLMADSLQNKAIGMNFLYFFILIVLIILVGGTYRQLQRKR